VHPTPSSSNFSPASNTIESLVAQGTTVVCDRYYYSGVVYSAAKENPALPLGWARAPEAGLPRPDAVLFLDLAEDAARARGGWGGEVYERAEMQRRVRALFRALAAGTAGGGAGGSGEAGPAAAASAFVEEKEDLVVVDADGSVDEVAERVWAVVQGVVEAVAEGGDALRVVG
jgi:dTMP kinase